jgi:hypothetical protein
MIKRAVIIMNTIYFLLLKNKSLIQNRFENLDPLAFSDTFYFYA